MSDELVRKSQIKPENVLQKEHLNYIQSNEYV